MNEQWQELKKTIIELRDNGGTATQHEVCKFLAKLMNILEKQMSSSEKPNEWIPVSERLPEDGQRVLVDYCDEDAGIMLIRFNVNGYRGFKGWMPLPERYEASSTGGGKGE